MNIFERSVVIAAGVLTLFNLIDKIVTAIKATKSPIIFLEKRVEALERAEEETKKLFPKYDEKINDIEEGNKVTQKAILAMLTHSIEGNHTEEMKRAREALQEYLINK